MRWTPSVAVSQSTFVFFCLEVLMRNLRSTEIWLINNGVMRDEDERWEMRDDAPSSEGPSYCSNAYSGVLRVLQYRCKVPREGFRTAASLHLNNNSPFTLTAFLHTLYPGGSNVIRPFTNSILYHTHIMHWNTCFLLSQSNQHLQHVCHSHFLLCHGG